MRNVITNRQVGDLVPFDRNSRTHSEAQVAQLAASIKEFGFTNPVLIDDDNTIIAGEGRVRAARRLKLAEVPCVVLTGLTAAQKAAYVIADNKLGLNSDWDAELLHSELARLSDLNFDINLTGFNDVEALELSSDVATGLAALAEGETPPTGETTTTDPAADKKDWSGMPEFVQSDDRPFRSVLVHFNNQEAVDAYALLIVQNITSKTKYVWYPKQVRVAVPAEVYA